MHSTKFKLNSIDFISNYNLKTQDISLTNSLTENSLNSQYKLFAVICDKSIISLIIKDYILREVRAGRIKFSFKYSDESSS